jgi:tetratricopeptide (TPR) repeat protein
VVEVNREIAINRYMGAAAHIAAAALCLGALVACNRAVLPVPSPTGRGEQPRRSAPAPLASPYAYEWFVRAELLEARGQHAAAAEAYRNALATADPDPFVLGRLANALDLGGDRGAAERAIDAGLELDPRSEALWLVRGHIAARHRAWNESVAAFERAQSSAPESAAGSLAQAALLRERGQTERAIAILDALAARLPKESGAALHARLELALTQRDAGQLSSAAAALVAHGRRTDQDLLRRSAQRLVATGQAALASRLLASLPRSPEVAALRLRVAQDLGRRDEVERILVTTPPNALGTPLDLAETYLAIQRPAQALEQLGLVDRASAPHRFALLHARALLALGDPGQAALQLARIPPDSANHPAARIALAHALQAGGLPSLASELENR